MVAAGEGHEGGGGVGPVLRRAGGEHGDLFPDEAEDGLVGGDGGEAEVLVGAIVGGGGDAEEPRDVADGVFEEGGGFAERGGGDDGDDGEHALHELVGAALED